MSNIQIIKDGKTTRIITEREREKARERQRTMRQSIKGKNHLAEIQKKYIQSVKGKESKRIWNAKPENKAKQKEYDKNRNIARKIAVLNHYGDKCACCGEKRWEFLVIDHINGGGAKHVKELNCGGGSGFYHWLIKNHFPEGFRTLCDNCNMSLGRYGYCPHTEEKKHEN